MSRVALPPFWSLVEAHGDELLVHARRMTGDANGEDVLQDALLRALRALLELPFERVLVSHGEPVHARADFEAALEREPWSAWSGA